MLLCAHVEGHGHEEADTVIVSRLSNSILVTLAQAKTHPLRLTEKGLHSLLPAMNLVHPVAVHPRGVNFASGPVVPSGCQISL